MTSTRVLFDLSNLKTGGGLQVGASLVDEIATLATSDEGRWPWLRAAHIEISPAVHANTTRDLHPLKVHVVDGSPRKKLTSPTRDRGYQVSLTLFGPQYARRRAYCEIVGFADVTSLWPTLSLVKGGRGRVLKFARRQVSRATFSRADLIIVESEHTKRQLVSSWGFNASQIQIIPNTVNEVFSDTEYERIHIPPGLGTRVCFPTRAYPHKNLSILGACAAELDRLVGKPVTFVLTLSEEEWSRLDERTKSHSYNIGPLPIAKMPSLYHQCDSVVFPSLLESFSVTPLEALATRTPLAASDRDFVRGIVGPAAAYFDPHDASSVARAISLALSDEAATRNRVEQGSMIVAEWPTAADRAKRYLDIVHTQLGGSS